MADARAVATRAAEPMTRAIAGLAAAVTEAPWALSPEDRARAHAAGLDDERVVHVVALASYFGHLNRVADAVGIELDYEVRLTPPHAEPATPPYLRPARDAWPAIGASSALSLAAIRPAAAELLAAWRSHALDRTTDALPPTRRAVIASAVAAALGDASIAPVAPGDALDAALVALADEVTLAPWRLGADTLTALRTAGLSDDAAVFDAVATATACTTFSRLTVALAALG